ncbi:MAG: hypothetical protein HOP16_06260 [Acidobacteria bacterium]|nr:hypothetical protein [Acidobacteriota bacterium]
MSRRIALRVMCVLVLLCAATPVLAHHGAATFDTTNEITIKGTVSAWSWANPHCILHVDVKAPDGTVKTWSVASSNVADLSKRGWTRRTFAAGDEVTVLIQPAKSGEPVGMIRNVQLADGRKLQ